MDKYLHCQVHLIMDATVSSVVQSCPILCDPLDYSLPGSSVHRIFQARILEWVAISSCRGSSWFRDRTLVSCVSCIDSRFFTAESLGSPVDAICSHNICCLLLLLNLRWASLVAQLVKDLPAVWETWVRLLRWEDPLEKGTATYSSILAWRWTKRSQKNGHDWVDFTFTFNSSGSPQPPSPRHGKSSFISSMGTHSLSRGTSSSNWKQGLTNTPSAVLKAWIGLLTVNENMMDYSHPLFQIQKGIYSKPCKRRVPVIFLFFGGGDGALYYWVEIVSSLFPPFPENTHTHADIHALTSRCLRIFRNWGGLVFDEPFLQGKDTLGLRKVRKEDEKGQNTRWSRCPGPSYTATHSCLEEVLQIWF